MQLWQHKKNPDIKFAATPEGEEVHIWTVKLTPNAEYHPPHLWAYSGKFPRKQFMELYEPVPLDDTDEVTKEFWLEFGPSRSTK